MTTHFDGADSKAASPRSGTDLAGDPEGLNALAAAIIASTDEGVAAISPEGVVVMVNEAAARIFGITPSEAIGRSIRSGKRSGEAGEPATSIDRVLRGERVPPYDTVRARSDGSLMELSVALSPLVQSGRVVGAAAIFRDVTPLRQAERALVASQRQYRDLVEDSVDLISLATVDGVLKYVNKSYARHFGRQPQDMVGSNLFDFVLAADRESVAARLRRVVDEDCVLTSENRMMSAAGAECWMEWTNRVVVGDAAGERLVHSLGRDISDRRRAESEAHLRVVAEQANRTKSEFLARMSHELRTPLNAILGFAQILDRTAAASWSTSQRNYVQQIEAAGWHLLHLVNDVLDIAQVESGKLRLDMTCVDVRGEVTQALDLEWPHAMQWNVHLEGPMPADANPKAMVDRRRFQQVLLNVISNAIKYNRPQGRVRIDLSEPGDGYVEVAISDTGLGMSAADVDRIFAPFERIGMERSRIQGTGLGLVVSRWLLKGMGGSIGASSVPGTGSTFRIRVPAAPRT